MFGCVYSSKHAVKGGPGPVSDCPCPLCPAGHHSLCIQSMDGMLMFFEQDSYSFGRFLPGFLLPGPLVYNPRTDSFLTVSSARQLESYK